LCTSVRWRGASGRRDARRPHPPQAGARGSGRPSGHDRRGPMADDVGFADLIARVRAGDEAAADELFRRYERAVRVRVRARLTGAAVRRVLDSIDVCQDVMKSFFVRVRAGQYDLHSPHQLVALLVRMAEFKAVSLVQHHHRSRRDCDRVTADSGALATVPDPADDPAEVTADRELLVRVRDGLSPEERPVAEMWAAGLSWDEVATQLGGTAEGRRKQLNR